MGRPRGCPGTIVVSSGEKYVSTKFHYFRKKYFLLFRIFPQLVIDTVTTKCNETKSGLSNIAQKPQENKKTTFWPK